ncbi:phosphonate metabolism protein/1,5-bisphosphokinase (PRPP-forming) PhnN [Pseudodesulfovibrio indicus]|uniref:phosphonate metabolism protein/1,5-bisphosphokinase (PRPP-forming) PhnN n=1 Tax=Pseudodesulfovibrio indicus TaxID=1716143 RepID=UPI00292F9FD6|nr:phosphonate metabolism protein/1,5-bisphosphokinase (PRPP-forming) PhnN [Pseudodesulfovibrio indicus]
MTPGTLIYVIGPSGCGKDSLMNYARSRCPGGEAAFAHRYITRAADAGGENHVALLPDEYQGRLDSGLFALAWDSHGCRYGVGAEIDQWMEAGLNVVVNGSRAYLPEAARRYPGMLPVLVTLDLGILRQRLILRGRETMDEIEARLDRAGAYSVSHPALVRLDNSGELSDGGRRLLELVRRRPARMRRAV